MHACKWGYHNYIRYPCIRWPSNAASCHTGAWSGRQLLACMHAGSDGQSHASINSDKVTLMTDLEINRAPRNVAGHFGAQGVRRRAGRILTPLENTPHRGHQVGQV